MKTLILSFSNNLVNQESFIPNKMGLTFSCVEVCENKLREQGIEVEHICINKKNIKKCNACGKRGWGICADKHICVQDDDFNDIYKHMGDFERFIFVTPVYFHEMSESAKTFFDRLKRCDAFNDESKIKVLRAKIIILNDGYLKEWNDFIEANHDYKHLIVSHRYIDECIKRKKKVEFDDYLNLFPFSFKIPLSSFKNLELILNQMIHLLETQKKLFIKII